MNKWITIALILFCFKLRAQDFKFAHVTDTHVGSETGAADLRNTVRDINQQDALKFVIISGDITEFGADEELKLAKQILDSIQIPYYIIPGNHDANWSESGGNSFRKFFGAETFYFTYNGYRFAGTNSGPNMRMSPGQVPRENLVWLDSVLLLDKEMPLIYINHYPQDSSLNNWYEAIDRIKQHDIRLLLCGHGHTNKLDTFEGIPSVMGRSNLRAKQTIGGYNIVTIKEDQAIYQERHPDSTTQMPWLTLTLKNHHFQEETKAYPRPSFRMNSLYKQVKSAWMYEDQSDIGSGLTYAEGKIITGNTQGEVYALDKQTGKKIWAYQTKGKIYSTPAVWKKTVVVGSTDNHIYGLDLTSGQIKWQIKTQKAVLGSPALDQGVAYIGASDGSFRAINTLTGKVIWTFNGLKGYVSAKPLVYKGKVYFGTWGNEFYALDIKTGKKVWEWSNGTTSRMLSPAACYPVAAHGRIFLVAPDRYMTALEAETGVVLWRKKLDQYRVRESIGLSKDKKLVYAKTMDGQLIGVSTVAKDMDIVWESGLRLPYELAPTNIIEHRSLVLVPSNSGLLSAVDRKTGTVKWQYKISNCLINPLLPLGKNKLAVSTMDGKIATLNY